MPTILMSEDRTQTEERILAALMEEALQALERFLESGSRDQTQEAFDCLRAWGLSPLSLGEVDSWDIRFAQQLFFFLATN